MLQLKSVTSSDDYVFYAAQLSKTDQLTSKHVHDLYLLWTHGNKKILVRSPVGEKRRQEN